MTGQTLTSVLNLVKSEIRASLSAGTADDALLKQAIETTQEWMCAEYDWSELKDKWDVNTTVGVPGRYTVFPTTDIVAATYAINFDRPFRLENKYNSVWRDIDFGIDSELYNSQDSDDGDTQDPIQSWDHKPGDKSYFEIWPLAVTSTTLRFHGQRKAKTLRTASVLDGTKVLDIDDMLVALSVAVDYLSGKPEQAAKITKLRERFARVRGSSKTSDEKIIMGGGRKPRKMFRRVPIITTA